MGKKGLHFAFVDEKVTFLAHHTAHGVQNLGKCS